MVRTKAGSVSNKAIGAKAPQKVTITAILSGNAPKSKHTGGNPYHPRETPGWQKPITFFMKQDGQSSKDESIEIEDLPGLPGIRGDVISPKASGSKRKPKERKPKEQSEGDVEKKVKSKKLSKKREAEENVEEKPKSNKKKDRSDVDVDKKSKKKKKEEANHSEMEVDDESKDEDEAVGGKENAKNYESSESDVDMEDEGAGNNGSRNNAKKNVHTNSKNEEKSDMLNREENKIKMQNKDTTAPNCIIGKNQETDEETEKKIQKIEGNNDDDSLTNEDEPKSTENIDEDEASEPV